MSTHQMNLQPQPFEKIKSGKKTIEVRLFDEKRQKIKLSDEIIFTNTESNETLKTKVVGLHKFESFVEMFSELSGVNAGWREADTPEKITQDMRKYYVKEDEDKYGVLGIYIKKV